MFRSLWHRLDRPDDNGRYRFTGPGNLGATVGFIVTGTILAIYYSVDWRGLSYEFFIGTAVSLLSGSAGGCLGGVIARHEDLREAWSKHRCIVAPIFGAIIAVCVTFWTGQLIPIMASCVGGAVGGIVDARVHREYLEEGD